MSKVRKRDLGGIMVVPARSPKSIRLPEATERELAECSIAFTAVQAKTIVSIFEMGRILKKAQALLAKHGTGRFGKWVVKQCGISRQSAGNYIRVFDAFSRNDCKRLCQSSSIEALYFFAREGTPEEAIKDAMRLAKEGMPITLKEAKKIVAEYTLEESNGETTDQSAAAEDTTEGADATEAAYDVGDGAERQEEPAGDTSDGDDATDRAADAEDGADQESEPSTEKADTGAVDDHSYPQYFADSIKRSIKYWSSSCTEKEVSQFPKVLRDEADELDAAKSPPVLNDRDS